MRTSTCDICGGRTNDPYPRGWGSLRRGLDQEADICPECLGIVVNVLAELRRMRQPLQATDRQAAAALANARKDPP